MSFKLTVTVKTRFDHATVLKALDRAEDRQPNVQDLLEALNRLTVPFKDRVSILEEIHRAGRLHAKLLYES